MALATVVDGQLRLDGLQGLRIVDSSMMPTTPSANVCAATMMVADTATDLICGKPAPGAC